MKVADVFIQAGHENKKHGNTGAYSPWGSEQEWCPIVADEAVRVLRDAEISVIREDAFLGPEKYKVKIALFLHFDSSNGNGCHSGASIGYDDPTDKPAADEWRSLYKGYWPYRWMRDNFTTNLSRYYGFKYTITSDAELVLELGELTCREQAMWLKPRLKWLGQLIAHFVAKRIGNKEIPVPSLEDIGKEENAFLAINDIKSATEAKKSAASCKLAHEDPQPEHTEYPAGGYEACSKGWTVTGYYTPLEDEYTSSSKIKVYVHKHGETELNAEFLKDVKMEGWGRTTEGWCVGYYRTGDGGYAFTKSAEPLDAEGWPLSAETVAVDNRKVEAGAHILLPEIDELRTKLFVATDVGAAIDGKHIDVYCGEGEKAKKLTYKITRNRPHNKTIVCSDGMV